MVGIRYCCWGECKIDLRYLEKWLELLKELERLVQKVFIFFLKLVKDFVKCKCWLVVCLWEFFMEKNVNENVYICVFYGFGGKGFIDEFLDLFKVNFILK